jgi:hypothetical protein
VVFVHSAFSYNALTTRGFKVYRQSGGSKRIFGRLAHAAWPLGGSGSFPVVRVLTTIIYKPFGLIAGVVAAIISNKIFNFIWSRFDDEEPPEPNTELAPMAKVLTAAALQGMVFKTVRVAVDRGTAKSFQHFTGVWPGERTPDQA